MVGIHSYAAIARAQPYGLIALRSRGIKYWWTGLGLVVLGLMYVAPLAASFRVPSIGATSKPALPVLTLPSVPVPVFSVPKVHALAPLPPVHRAAPSAASSPAQAATARKSTHTHPLSAPVVTDSHSQVVAPPSSASGATNKDSFANAPTVSDSIGVPVAIPVAAPVHTAPPSTDAVAPAVTPVVATPAEPAPPAASPAADAPVVDPSDVTPTTTPSTGDLVPESTQSSGYQLLSEGPTDTTTQQSSGSTTDTSTPASSTDTTTTAPAATPPAADPPAATPPAADPPAATPPAATPPAPVTIGSGNVVSISSNGPSLVVNVDGTSTTHAARQRHPLRHHRLDAEHRPRGRDIHRADQFAGGSLQSPTPRPLRLDDQRRRHGHGDRRRSRHDLNFKDVTCVYAGGPADTLHGPAADSTWTITAPGSAASAARRSAASRISPAPRKQGHVRR